MLKENANINFLIIYFIGRECKEREKNKKTVERKGGLWMRDASQEFMFETSIIIFQLLIHSAIILRNNLLL
jgi:hypothetical protein